MAVSREEIMEKERFSKEWINRGILAALRNEGRETYAKLRSLREVADEELRVVVRLPGRIRTVSRDFVAEVHPLKDHAPRARSVAPYSPTA